ncbi:MAG: DEAD/DEAH box helicase [Saprospiraceae bacterium]|nr:DEAD/DEAH box helicase [Saprospiraceae bacterium]MCF8252128.1 DEAD/DEAH box helicase [Saprospiraceae bacterium]MCF8281852.1 DEAD/DEAH box helicase [Bacteroidales bacterium]MCF8313794.1 DEAD/DEAH box helicase [Saprospiraceae bacterium]MCF8442503.1 DEAD/DEAH box helicase [Saprospiraceae bacterium]
MATKTAKTTKSKPKKTPKEKKISFHRQPEDLSLERWQTALRKQFGKDSAFTFENAGQHPVFSDFVVKNPDTGNAYQVAIRSRDDAANHCSCMDFRTNRLGTCKHISFLLNKLENKRGNKKLLKTGYRQPHSSIYLDYRAGRKVKLSIGTEAEAEFQKFAKKYFDAQLEIKPEGFANFEKLLAEARRIHEDFRCYDDALEFVLAQREHIQRQAHLAKICPKGAVSPLLDSLLNVTLYPYQRQGVLFAAQAGRCLLADEMGLGKTIQAIAAAKLFKNEFGVAKVLVVCPTSLKYQWKSEIERFTELSVHVVEGTVHRRHKEYLENEAFFTIAGYHTVANDLRQLNEQEYDLVILDEAQRIKNWQTKTSAAIKRLQSTYAIVLTGTPLENKLDELYSIMQFIDQFRLPPLYQFLHRYQVTDDNGKVVGFKNLREIGENLSDVLLRRRKREVLKDLPKRMDKTLLVPMTTAQMDMHTGYADEVAKLVARWVKQRFLNEKDRKRLMLNMSMMRMVCDSTYILDQTNRHDTKVDELMCILEEFFANQDGEKVVVFSQWKRMLELVEMEMQERGIGYQFLHGSVPSQQRGGLLKTFREDPDCLVFLSTDAGGVGLNLQNACLVVNMDIPWNPALLEQRIARVWRMGQESAVQVLNLVSAGTIEHRMLGVLKFKDAMAKGVLDEGEDVIFMETSRFNDFMGKMVDLTGQGWVATGTEEVQESLEAEAADIAAPEEVPVPMEAGSSRSLSGPAIIGDDDVKVGSSPTLVGVGSGQSGSSEQGSSEVAPKKRGDGMPSTPEELVQTGVSFLSGLAKTLSDPAATQQLVSSLTAKDEATGQTYLRIPVENEATVANALQVLGGLFRAFGNK